MGFAEFLEFTAAARSVAEAYAMPILIRYTQLCVSLAMLRASQLECKATRFGLNRTEPEILHMASRCFHWCETNTSNLRHATIADSVPTPFVTVNCMQLQTIKFRELFAGLQSLYAA